MAKDSIKDRLKITKSGKVKHRKPGQSHSKSNKTSSQRNRKKGENDMDIKESRVKQMMNN